MNDAWDYHGKIMSSEIFRIKTGFRLSIGDVGRKSWDGKCEIYMNPFPTEIDIHADTHCFGRKIRPIKCTGQECSVAPFMAEYSEQMNIQIFTGTTAHTLDSGEMVIFLFVQGL